MKESMTYEQKKFRNVLGTLDKVIQLFCNYMERTLHRPTQKNIHKFRVSARKLRVFYGLLKQSDIKGIPAKKITKELRKLGEKLGNRRELDVLEQDATRYHLKIKNLKELKKMRQKDLAVFLDKKFQKKILLLLKKSQRNLHQMPELNLKPGLSRLGKQLSSWKGNKFLKKSVYYQGTDDTLHELRIMLKKTRYALEFIDRPNETLRNLQEDLGQWHDLQVLKEYTKNHRIFKKDEARVTEKARRLIKPAIQFALQELPH